MVAVVACVDVRLAGFCRSPGIPDAASIAAPGGDGARRGDDPLFTT
jgi:hypothetical protein